MIEYLVIEHSEFLLIPRVAEYCPGDINQYHTQVS